ncbi:hypothetical protein ALP8811_02022 [Aliiroseovarius pelagivivens]|uniref:Uncharacterized protein n=1 Tax=Aliiroseovarius pelagivivens TaxID=1639690 RepID=A0A2R8ALS9_9RHOB|nr:hypothetical protein [Aliiroseovarius pelagivivens]SPF77003.1 hypothetical protein ALP8811_02022 [Aliiroseovarius pelagivivens]
MSLKVADFVNEAPPSGSIGSIDSVLTEVDLKSPIDEYIKSSRSLLSYGTVDRLSQNGHLGGLLVLGSVSAAEAYFRSILSLSLEGCPICRETAAEKSINLGGVLWHGHSEFRRSAFEHMSFSSRAELKKASQGYLGFELKDAKFSGPLKEFDIACHLRHGLVHNGGILPGRNAVQLGAQRYRKPVRIAVDFSMLQRTVAAVDTLVLTFNRELFDEMCHRWAEKWRRRADWDPSKEGETFRKLWKNFSCNELHQTRNGRSSISRGKCLAEVKAKYNL